MFKRARALLDPAQRFVALVRVAEGILSRASVLGCKRQDNQHNKLEHELALARATFQCSASRQSRHSLWHNYAERLLKDIKEEQQRENPMAKYLNVIGPCTQVEKIPLFRVKEPQLSIHVRPSIGVLQG